MWRVNDVPTTMPILNTKKKRVEFKSLTLTLALGQSYEEIWEEEIKVKSMLSGDSYQ